MILEGIFYFYFAQLHEMLCTNLIDFYRSLSRRKFIQREKRREEANFGPIWYFFLFSILLPTSPYRFLGPFLWKLAVISIHTFPFILFIDDSRFPWANIGSRKGRIGRIFSISRQKLVKNGYKTSVPNEKGKEIRRWSINPDGKFGYSKMCGDWR